MTIESRNVAGFPSLKRKAVEYATRLSELDSRKPYGKEVSNAGKCGDEEVDRDYDWLLKLMLQTYKQKIVKRSENVVENVIRYENVNDFEDEDEREEDVDEDEDEEEEVEEEEEDVNDEDPQYCLFLQNLVKSGRSYKLKISKDDETPRFLHYEESEDDDDDDDDDDSTYEEYVNEFTQDMQIVQRDEQMLFGKEGEIVTVNEVSRKKKIKERKSVLEPYLGTFDPCYLIWLKGYNPSNGKFFHEGKEVEYEKQNKQLVLAEKRQGLPAKRKAVPEKRPVLPVKRVVVPEKRLVLPEKRQKLPETRLVLPEKQLVLPETRLVVPEKRLLLPEKQLVLAEKCPSLKEKLMRILRKPYSEREYRELREYAEEQKPICRLLPLRHRSVSSALDGMTKSVLDDSPGCFRRRFKAAKQEPYKAKALNLLRMLRFWLEHMPNEDIFEPWLDKDILEVLPVPRLT